MNRDLIERRETGFYVVGVVYRLTASFGSTAMAKILKRSSRTTGRVSV